MKPVVIVQHVACEGPGNILPALTQIDIPTTTIRVFQGDAVPQDSSLFSGLIIMGGPMGVNDVATLPHLTAELRLIENALHNDVPILGVCLGSQLLAHALGARVYPGERREIGWHSVEFTDHAHSDRLLEGIASPLTVFHWHGDIFDPPRNATPLARSLQTPLQAFRYGSNVYGFLFHLEVTAAAITEMASTFPADLNAVGITTQRLADETKRYESALTCIADTVFSRWAALLNR